MGVAASVDGDGCDERCMCDGRNNVIVAGSQATSLVMVMVSMRDGDGRATLYTKYLQESASLTSTSTW